MSDHKDKPQDHDLSPVLPPAVPLLYRGKAFITFEMMESFHGRLEGAARKTFHANRRRLVEGEDFVKVSVKEFAELMAQAQQTSQRPSNGLSENLGGRDRVLLFEPGYLMLSKPWNDDAAWRVQRGLVLRYYHSQAPAIVPAPADVAAILARCDALTARLASIEHTLAEVVRPADVKDPVRFAHLRVVLAKRAGICPCCCKTPIASAVTGGWTPNGYCINRYFGVQFASLERTWPVCQECRHRLRDRRFKNARLRHFEGFQEAILEWQAEEAARLAEGQLDLFREGAKAARKRRKA